MASEGPRSPSASALIVTGWTNISNVYASNDTRAVAGLITAIMAATSYEFNIPTGATILGIQIDVEGHGNQVVAARRGLGASLTKNGTDLAGTAGAQLTLNQNTDTVITWGGPTSLWGTTWTPADFNSTSFGALLQPLGQSNSSYERRVDTVTITVYFDTEPIPVSKSVTKRIESNISVVEDHIAIQENLSGITRESVGKFESSQPISTVLLERFESIVSVINTEPIVLEALNSVSTLHQNVFESVKDILDAYVPPFESLSTLLRIYDVLYENLGIIAIDKWYASDWYSTGWYADDWYTGILYEAEGTPVYNQAVLLYEIKQQLSVTQQAKLESLLQNVRENTTLQESLKSILVDNDHVTESLLYTAQEQIIQNESQFTPVLNSFVVNENLDSKSVDKYVRNENLLKTFNVRDFIQENLLKTFNERDFIQENLVGVENERSTVFESKTEVGPYNIIRYENLGVSPPLQKDITAFIESLRTLSATNIARVESGVSIDSRELSALWENLRGVTDAAIYLVESSARLSAERAALYENKVSTTVTSSPLYEDLTFRAVQNTTFVESLHGLLQVGLLRYESLGLLAALQVSKVLSYENRQYLIINRHGRVENIQGVSSVDIFTTENLYHTHSVRSNWFENLIKYNPLYSVIYENLGTPVLVSTHQMFYESIAGVRRTTEYLLESKRALSSTDAALIENLLSVLHTQTTQVENLVGLLVTLESLKENFGYITAGRTASYESRRDLLKSINTLIENLYALTHSDISTLYENLDTLRTYHNILYMTIGDVAITPHRRTLIVPPKSGLIVGPRSRLRA